MGIYIIYGSRQGYPVPRDLGVRGMVRGIRNPLIRKEYPEYPEYPAQKSFPREIPRAAIVPLSINYTCILWIMGDTYILCVFPAINMCFVRGIYIFIV